MDVVLRWDPEKQEKLKATHDRFNVTFEDCAQAILDNKILENLPHPTRKNQRLFVLVIRNYAFVVPAVQEAENHWFLKTVYPSRKFTAKHLRKPNDV